MADGRDQLHLVRTSKSRGGGDDDYDVCDGNQIIGRIVRHPQAPMEAPWFWVIVAEGLTPSWLMDRGYAVSREQALAEFRARWTLNDLVCPRLADQPTPTMPAFIGRCVHCNAQIWVALNSPKTRRTADLLRFFANRIQTGEETQSVVGDMREQEKRIAGVCPD